MRQSDFLSGIVTQTPIEDLKKPKDDQVHEPLAFLGCEFQGSAKNWTTFEKEGFAIFQVFEKLNYLMMSEQPVHVFTDHRNLHFVFAPLVMLPNAGNHVVSKVQRWAMFLSRFSFSIEHIEGHRNVFADILTRWGRGYRTEREPITTAKVCSLVMLNN